MKAEAQKIDDVVEMGFVPSLRRVSRESVTPQRPPGAVSARVGPKAPTFSRKLRR